MTIAIWLNTDLEGYHNPMLLARSHTSPLRHCAVCDQPRYCYQDLTKGEPTPDDYYCDDCVERELLTPHAGNTVMNWCVSVNGTPLVTARHHVDPQHDWLALAPDYSHLA